MTSQSNIGVLFQLPGGQPFSNQTVGVSGAYNGSSNKGIAMTHAGINNNTWTGHILPPAVVGDQVGYGRDLMHTSIEAVGLTTQAPANPCRATTESGECILFKEIPLVYANDRDTVVALNSGTVVRETKMMRAVLDKGGVQGHVATQFCGDPASLGLSQVFYTVGYAGGRAACSAAQLLPAAALFGQFSSTRLNRQTAMWQTAEIAALNAFDLYVLYTNNFDGFSHNSAVGSRRGFINYLGSYASAQSNAGRQLSLSVYGIQFPIGAEEDVAEDASCATVNCGGPSDAELTNTDLYVHLATNAWTYYPTRGGPNVPADVYSGSSDFTTSS